MNATKGRFKNPGKGRVPRRALRKHAEQSSPVTASSSSCQTLENREEKVRKKAYELFEKRGHQHGHHEEDWHEAEKSVE